MMMDCLTTRLPADGPRTMLLREALKVAQDGQTALVIVPHAADVSACVSALVHLLDPQPSHLRVGSMSLRFEGTRGSVRIYPASHAEWSTLMKVMRGYPLGVPTFVIE